MKSQAAFLEAHGWAEARQEPLAGDASARRYIRLYHGETRAILMIDPSNETERFADMSRHLGSIGLSAPQVLAETRGFLLLEDFGNDTLAHVIERDPASEIPLYGTATDVLCYLETAPLPTGLAIATPQTLAQMIAPVFADYVSVFGGTRTDGETELVQELEACLDRVLTRETVLVLRDHHAENMMWLPERAGVRRIGLLDFQDALLGPPVYDLVSMLQDARRDVSEACQTATLARYARRSGRDMVDVLAAFHLLGLQRNLRILGIFTRLATEKAKPGYLDLVPRVWGHIQTSLHAPVARSLRALVDRVIPPPTETMLGKVKERCRTQ